MDETVVMKSQDQARVTIAAGGDVGTGHNPPEIAFASVRRVLSRADIRFAQVERLYSERGTYQWQSLARNLEVRQPPQQAEVFRSVPFDVLSLASNHTGDWGPEAVEDTVDTFRRLGIPTVGAGRNIAEARRPAIIERQGLRVAFLGYCSVLLPQYWAEDERAGCAPMRAHTLYEPYEYQPGSPARVVTIPHELDLRALVQDVRHARETADAVVVSMHWGLHYVAKPFAYQTRCQAVRIPDCHRACRH
jgi:poly-gamma-glutamate capsule biosynthesis protein CapA/YwtB (metallophosphatase superfamily)